MRYREHRGGLAESLSTTQEFDCVESIMNHVSQCAASNGIKAESVNFKDIGFDHRTGWNTFQVSVVQRGQSFVMGHSDSDGNVV